MVTSVKFDSYESPLINPISNEELEVTVPLPNAPFHSESWKISALNFETAFGPISVHDKNILILKPNPPPKIISVVPAVGSRKGGTEVQIFGDGFHKNTSVRFGELACGGIKWKNKNTLSCKTPMHHGGPIDVNVENPDSQNSRLKNGFFYSWAQHFGLQDTFSEGNQIASDKSGNFYIAGNSSYNSQGEEFSEATKGFLLKLNPDGLTLWKIFLGKETQTSFIKSIALTPKNHVLVAGYQTGSHGPQAFISQYSHQGELIWTQPLLKSQEGETFSSSPIIETVLSDKVGDIFVVGSTDIDLQNRTPISGWRAFVAKLDSKGIMFWSHHEGKADPSGYHLVLGKTAVFDSKGDLILGGSAVTQLNEDSGPATGPLFISKYQVQGLESPKRLWLKKINEIPNSTPHTLEMISISLSKQDEPVILTRYQPIKTTEKPSRFYSLNKLTASGEIVFWKNHSSFVENVDLEKPVIDSSENIFLIGKKIKDCHDNMTCKGSDVFIAKLDKSGKNRWQQSKVTLASTTANAAIIHEGEIYVTGSVQGNLDEEPSVGHQDILISRYSLEGEIK
jgi:hypothetical protein